MLCSTLLALAPAKSIEDILGAFMLAHLVDEPVYIGVGSHGAVQGFPGQYQSTLIDTDRVQRSGFSFCSASSV